MKALLSSFAGTLLALLLVAGLTVGYGAWVTREKTNIKDGSYLVVELFEPLLEYDPPGGVMTRLVGGDLETLQRVLDNLRKARVDDRIDGVILKVSVGADMGSATREEIRNAIKRLRDSGKKVYGYAESFEASQYHLLAACDEIVVPPAAYLSFTGFLSSSTHVKRALEKLVIQPNVHKIKDYKSAAELVIREDMSEAARENKVWMLDDYWEVFVETLAKDRGLSEGRIGQLMEQATFTAQMALNAGLVDRLLYWDEVEQMLKADDDESLRTVTQVRYARESPGDVGLDGDKTVAVVHAQGNIFGRRSSVNPLLGLTMGHETIVDALREAREDEEIAAIVFRVNSSGGDSLASDLIGHEVEITAAVKPLVVSMVDAAASGGYSISYRATRIVADATTVTGSIGSISGKFNVAGFLEDAGVTHDHVTRGPRATMNSSLTDYTPEEREIFEATHWASFNRWLQDISKHRGMSFQKAETLAHGRVWSGRQAVANGLVDELGDLEHAVGLAKRLAGIPDEEEVSLVHYPARKSLLGSLIAGDVAAAARSAVYRAVREELSETWNLVTENPEPVLAWMQ